MWVRSIRVGSRCLPDAIFSAAGTEAKVPEQKKRRMEYFGLKGGHFMYSTSWKRSQGEANQWGLILLFAILALTMSACKQSGNPAQEIVSMTGIFTTVWNGDAHYSLTDDAGNRYTILLEAETAKSIGGPLNADRKRVVLEGYFVSEAKDVFQVTSIELAKP